MLFFTEDNEGNEGAAALSIGFAFADFLADGVEWYRWNILHSLLESLRAKRRFTPVVSENPDSNVAMSQIIEKVIRKPF